MAKQSNFAERIFLLLAMITTGGLLGALNIAPFPQIADSARMTMTVVGGMFSSRPSILLPLTYEGEGLVTHDTARSQPGLTLVQGIMENGHEVRLLGPDGETLHSWTPDFYASWPNASEVIPAKRIPASQNHYVSQGLYPLPDGSLIVNFSGLGTARIDACSNTMWASTAPRHHSVTPDGQGNFWIPGHIPASDTPSEWMPDGLDPQEIEDDIATDHYYHDSVTLMSADGETLREFSVLRAIVEAGLEGALYLSAQDLRTDATHINDIDLVTALLADRIENVNEGDLLVSLRAMNMIAILDARSGALKWHRQGGWVRQHDPDITADGMIDIYNNRSPEIRALGAGSQIVRFDPSTDTSEVLVDGFFSDIMGVHQLLDNGNRLVVESRAGRVFEVTPQGEVVWDYRQPWDDEYAALFSFGMRVPTDFFEEEFPTCTN
ncbi:arylsulfotransferase family protein [Aurantiacibacter sp. D1-12]|uniref:arylsulfotransferase family protein n=1 Tax=Aurantiacibacter sp. D1-12 TaxID=2993658 RepID=UPI00237D2441|nr:arylsulfotransferase family protein [Aurantiacibacter sp. D1-12]MDE1467574.1 hypothetical protein [Aurantiacibacter sp. D1-12]